MSYISGMDGKEKPVAPKKPKSVPKGIKQGTSTVQFWRKKK